MYINGKWQSAKRGVTFDAFNPANGVKIGQMPDGDSEDAVRAIQAANDALVTWSRTTATQRSTYLYGAHRIMMERQDGLAQLMIREQGKPIQAARNEVKH
jgi:succinate-semialdehyde dehydrogenase/glutarate-semialdehyde dehydrogenase